MARARTSGNCQREGMPFLDCAPEVTAVRTLAREAYPFVISTRKKIAPKEARAVSAVTFLQKLNGKSWSAISEQDSGVLPSLVAQVIHLINADSGSGRLLREFWKMSELTEIYH